MVRIENVTLQRGRRTVFKNLSLELGERRIGLIGDNGAGKSSLFRMLCELDAPIAGSVHLPRGDADAKGGPTRSVGMMFQNPDEQIIFPTVGEELALGLEVTGMHRREARERTRAWLQARGLGHWEERAITALSHGQRQHVCWLSLIIAAPRLLLLDEPFASLDLPGQALLEHEIRQASQQVFVSTHLLQHVRHFERVIWLEHGQVRADGPGDQVCAAYEADIERRIAAHACRIDREGETD